MNILGFLEGPLESLLVFLNDQGKLTIGWAIVVLTVIVRLVLLPLFVSQYRSARNMQQVAPLMQAVKKKYANDKRKQQEEMMRIFQEHRVNPFGSCLPIVFQVPVFIALYYVLRDFAKTHPDIAERSFMGIIPDVAQQFRDMGWGSLVLAAVYGLSQLLATEVSFATSPQTSELQRKIFRFIPIPIVAGLFLYPTVPAGLVLYWLTTNLWTGAQQVVLKRSLGPLKAIDPTEHGFEAHEVPDPSAKPKGFRAQIAQAREDAAQQAKQKSAERPKQTSAKPKPSSNKPKPGGSGKSGQKRRPPKKR